MNVNPSNVPEHFELMPPFGPLHEMVGPIYVKGPERGWIAGMRVEQRHHNKGPILHGGMMAFFVDTAFTYVCSRLRDPTLKGCLTTHLSMNFIGTATAGDWIEALVDPIRVGKRVAFLNCLVVKGAERIASASALFQLIA